MGEEITPRVASEFAEMIARVKEEIHKVIVGQEQLVDLTLSLIHI